MSETALLADHIDRQVEAILDVWRSTVDHYGDIPDSGRLSALSSWIMCPNCSTG